MGLRHGDVGGGRVYPSAAITAHQAFIARRRSLRPGEEYRFPTSEEWDAFLGHFERRKLSLGTCGQSFGSECVHEHACFSELRGEGASRGSGVGQGAAPGSRQPVRVALARPRTVCA
ncbi:hypothetical protein MHW47_02380 [Streptomyces sp. OfavH-34-F]|uniref:hypothetical protein n=1 Tax=Streptomyces sp. OfavH-34-F TaxID=2917760 RepID=UPI001EF1D037|nr:hypothetical protein [Streptomyces sp. OfavH-34-F]MCG7523299.1 hypothetical protein [Streptomyces sp. OfavH-34-F]